MTPAGSAVIGVDMGATKILAGLISPGGEILVREKVKTAGNKGPDEVLGRIAQAIGHCLEVALAEDMVVAGIGIGLPGPLDSERGIVIEAPNLKGWVNVPVRDHLEHALGLPVFIENDANLGTLGEALLGAGRGMPIVVGVFVGSGIGGGLVFDGKLFLGHHRIAGEVGHMPIRKGGATSGGGIPGTLEANAGRIAIEAKIRQRIKAGQKSYLEGALKKSSRITSSMIREALWVNDPVVTPVMEKAVAALASGCAGLFNLLDPSVLVVGGGVTEAVGDWMLPRLRTQVYPLTVGRTSPDQINIVPAALLDDAIVLGAGLWARQNLEKKA